MKARALVARNLRKLRVRAGLSQEALAVDAGIDRSYMSRLERAIENPTVAVLERIALALSVPMGEFFVTPAAGEPVPKPLRGGRKAKGGKRKTTIKGGRL